MASETGEECVVYMQTLNWYDNSRHCDFFWKSSVENTEASIANNVYDTR